MESRAFSCGSLTILIDDKSLQTFVSDGSSTISASHKLLAPKTDIDIINIVLDAMADQNHPLVEKGTKNPADSSWEIQSINRVTFSTIEGEA
jgi:hypothetical protein